MIKLCSITLIYLVCLIGDFTRKSCLSGCPNLIWASMSMFMMTLKKFNSIKKSIYSPKNGLKYQCITIITDMELFTIILETWVAIIIMITMATTMDTAMTTIMITTTTPTKRCRNARWQKTTWLAPGSC